MKLVAFLSFFTIALVTIAVVVTEQDLSFATKTVEQIEDVASSMRQDEEEVASTVLPQCKYVMVSSKPFMCAKDELILVTLQKADRYCLKGGFSQRMKDKIYCQFNGVDSSVRQTKSKSFL